VRVLGVDGCKGGWVVVELTDGSVTDCAFAATFGEVAARDAEAIGVDIPLGEPHTGVRASDAAARAFIGGRLSSSVFTTPPLAAVRAPDYVTACRISHDLTGKKLSKQSWALRTRILDADPSWRAAPERIREVHPETCFRHLAGVPLTTSKKTWAGIRQRTALLRAVGIELADDLGAVGALAAPDDVLDASVVALTAARIARDEAVSLPDPPERDVDGRPVAIWY
jgi:predicted RNase H-like nuclease